MAKNFWDKKNSYKKYLRFSNKTLLILEQMEEEEKKVGEEIEKMIVSSPQYQDLIKKLKDDGFDIEEFE